MSWRQNLLKRLADPNLAYILMLLGIYGLFFELSNPGALVPGILGGICLLLALFAFQTLPVNFAGVGLILLGTILFILEVKVQSYGGLTIGGLASLVFGSLLLFDSPEPWLRVSLGVMIPACWCSAGSSSSASGWWCAASGGRPLRASARWSACPDAWSRPSPAANGPARSSAMARSGTPSPSVARRGPTDRGGGDRRARRRACARATPDRKELPCPTCPSPSCWRWCCSSSPTRSG